MTIGRTVLGSDRDEAAATLLPIDPGAAALFEVGAADDDDNDDGAAVVVVNAELMDTDTRGCVGGAGRGVAACVAAPVSHSGVAASEAALDAAALAPAATAEVTVPSRGSCVAPSCVVCGSGTKE